MGVTSSIIVFEVYLPQKAKKPLLTRRHMEKRLQFACDYAHWTESDWSRVIWSDESKADYRLTIKHGAGNAMFWGCISSHGTGCLVKIDGIMDTNKYLDVLREYLKKSEEKMGLKRSEDVFQQDGAPCHTSKKALHGFHISKIHRLNWAPQSPDLNPIEMIWARIKRELSNYSFPPCNTNELVERVNCA
ncbi:hypothetical protein WA158_005846 [Blastocystis sp. Blastoise]